MTSKPHATVRYAGASCRLEPVGGRSRVYRKTRAGLVELRGAAAVRVVGVYERALGEKVRRPRYFAKRPPPWRRAKP